MNRNGLLKKITVIIAVITLVMAMCACGASSYDSSKTESFAPLPAPSTPAGSNGFAAADQGYYDEGAMVEWEEDDSMEMPAEEYDPMPTPDQDTGNIPVSSMTAALEGKNLKLVYTASLSVQTTDFDATQKDLTDLVNSLGGYFESSSIDNGSYYSDGNYKYGYYTVRVPNKKYQEFLNAIGEKCHVVNLSQNVENISEVYYETQGRLETYKIKQERLHELLKKADTMADIIEIENALSEVEYMIDQYTSSLRHYDSMVDYATINISIDKVTQFGTGVGEELSFWQRIANSFENGAINFTEGIADFIEWVSYNIFQIIIFVIIVICAFRFHLLTRIKKVLGIQEKSGVKLSRAEKRELKRAKKEAKKALKTDAVQQTAEYTEVKKDEAE